MVTGCSEEEDERREGGRTCIAASSKDSPSRLGIGVFGAGREKAMGFFV
jgi:hypothetical protein